MKNTTPKPRSLYDTRSHLIRGIDLKQGGLFGALSHILVFLAHTARHEWHASLMMFSSAMLVYLAILLLSFRGQLIALILFSAAVFSAPEQLPHVARILAFAVMLGGTLRFQLAILPFFLLILFWCLLFVASSRGFVPAPLAITADGETLRFALIELFGLLALHLLVWSNRLNRWLSRRPHVIDIRSLIIAMSLAAVVGCSLITGRVILDLSGSSFEAVATSALHERNSLFVALLGFLVTPILLGLAIGQLITQFLDQLRELSDPNRKLFRSDPGFPLLIEFRAIVRDVREMLDGALRSQKESSIRIRELEEAMKTREEEMRRRELDAGNLEKLMNNSPLGYIAVTGNGAVIALNERFFAISGIPQMRAIGQHYTALSGTALWQKEIISTIHWVCGNFEKLLDRESLRFFTSPLESSFLELEVRITTSHQLGLTETRTSETLSPSDVAITVFVRKLNDLRDFHIRRLHPATLLVLGCQALEVCGAIKREVTNLAHGVSDAGREIDEFLQDPRTGRYGKIGLLLREFSQFSELTIGEIENVLTRAEHRSPELAKIDLFAHFKFSVDYLFQLLGIDAPSPVSFDVNPKAPAEDMQKSGIQVDAAEFNGFLAAYLALIYSILPKAETLDISVGFEHIGAGTANLIPGANPGQYARITLTHPGQSITGNMVPENILLLDPSVEELGDIEAALTILLIHTQRLFGFLSVQSTIAKGTTITIYLPESPSLIERRPREFERHDARSKFEAENAPVLDEKNRICVLSRDERSAEGVRETFRRIGFQVDDATIETSQSDEFGFGGAGFGEPEVAPPKDTKRSSEVPSNLDDFDLVVIESAEGDFDIAPLLLEIAAKASSIPVLVLGQDPPDTDDGTPKASAYLSYPIDEQLLQRAASRLLARSPRAARITEPAPVEVVPSE
ncbi:MAG: hypothetical protein IT290_03885 [Deltaproteobacteria bacterium]|nr:hypothetical protein [Deltaproteobacteria bacterium]